MNILLRRKKVRKRMNSKGFSSIVGAMFMILIVWVLASAYFIYTLSQNTAYNVAVRERNQLDIDRMSESVQVVNGTYSVIVNNYVNVKAQIQNSGPSAVQFVTIWISASNSTGWSNHNFTQMQTSITVQGGKVYLLDLSLPLAGICTSNSSYDVASWLITARGNAVPLPKQPAITNNLIFAETTQGIGSLAMNFQDFRYYIVNGSSPNYFLSPYPSGYNAYYLQGARANKMAFRVVLTNFDRNLRTITLNNGSELFIIYPSSGGNYLSDRWFIISVNETSGAVFNSYAPIVLNFNQPTSVYFASSSMGTISPATSSLTASQVPNIGAVNLALVGQIGGTRFGQNIPFVSIEIVS